jgi:hypothetical protein
MTCYDQQTFVTRRIGSVANDGFELAPTESSIIFGNQQRFAFVFAAISDDWLANAG